MSGAGGAIHDQHAAGAAFRERLLRDQLLGKVVIEIGDAEVLRTLVYWSRAFRHWFSEMRERTQARAFDGGVEFFAFLLELVLGKIGGNVGPSRPTDHDARERLGHQEAIPGTHGPGALGLQMKGADGRAGHLRELDGAHLGAIDGTARAVGGEDGGMAALDHLLESQQAFARAAGAGAAHGVKAEELEDARDQFAVEALADEDGGVGAAEVEGAGKHALVPEAEDLRARAFAEGKRRDALLGDDFKAPGAAHEPEQRPNQARNHGQHEALAEGEPGSWLRWSLSKF